MSKHLEFGRSVVVTVFIILAPEMLDAEPTELANVIQISGLAVFSPANVSLDNGQIAFIGQTEATFARDVYFYDGATLSMLTDDLQSEDGIRLSEGRIVWSATIPGTRPQEFAVFFHEGGVTRQVSGSGAFRADIDGELIVWAETSGVYVLDLSTNQQRQIFAGESIFRGPSLHENQVTWIFDGKLYLYDLASDTLTPISTEVDLSSEPSLHSGQIAWNRGQMILLWDGTSILEIPTGDGVSPSEVSLSAGRIAWSAFDPVDFTSELYYFDGEATFRLTDISPGSFAKMPSLDGEQLAFAKSGDDQGLFLADIVTASGQVEALIQEIQDLIDTGVLNDGQGNALLSKLEAALASIEKGELGPALNKIRAFINQVEDFVDAGILTASEGQNLLDLANQILGLLD